MLAHTYFKKSNLRFLKSLGSQLQVVNTPAQSIPPITPGGGGGSFYFFPLCSVLSGVVECPNLPPEERRVLAKNSDLHYRLSLTLKIKQSRLLNADGLHHICYNTQR